MVGPKGRSLDADSRYSVAVGEELPPLPGRVPARRPKGGEDAYGKASVGGPDAWKRVQCR